MKQIFFMCLLALLLPSCRSCNASYEERRKGVQNVCPTCNFVMSESTYYAVDTAKQPNIIYRVQFKGGGLYYKASDVDHLIRVN